MLSLLTKIAVYALQLEMFPFFDIAHNFLAAMDIRNDIGQTFTKENPIISWFLTILCIFSGSLVANLLLGQSVLAPLSNTPLLIVATAVWFLVSFSPFDLAYRLGTLLPVKLLANILKEIYRVKKISSGVLQASQIHPNSWIIMIIIGTIRGNGAGVTKQLMQIAQNVYSPSHAKAVKTSLATRSCVISALFFVLKNKTPYISMSYELVYLSAVFFLVIGKVSALLFETSFDKDVKNENINKKKEN